MNGETPYVIRVRFKCRDFLVCVVIENAKLEVIRSRDKPVLAGDEFHAAHWNLCDFKCLDEGAGFVVVDVNRSIIQAGEQPWLCGMEINSLDAV